MCRTTNLNPKSTLWNQPQREGEIARLVMQRAEPQQLWDAECPSDGFRQPDRLPLSRPVLHVDSFVIQLPSLPQGPNDLHPAVRQRPVGTRRRVSAIQLLLEVRFRPSRMPQALPRQVIGHIPQRMQAVVAKLDRLALATAPGHRHGARHRLQGVGGGEARAIIADPGQQPGGCQRPLRARKGAPPGGFRVGGKDPSDLLDEGALLNVQRPQDGNEHPDMLDIPDLNRGVRHGYLQALVDQVKPLLDMGVMLPAQKCLHVRVSDLFRVLGCRELLDERQGQRRAHEGEQGQRDRVVLTQVVEQLVAQAALLSQCPVVGPNELLEMGHNLALLTVRAAVGVAQAQQVGQEKSIALVVFDTGRTAMGQDVRRCDVQISTLLHQPVDQQTIGAFNVDADVRQRLEQVMELVETGHVVGDGELAEDMPLLGGETQVMFVGSPIDTQVMHEKPSSLEWRQRSRRTWTGCSLAKALMARRFYDSRQVTTSGDSLLGSSWDGKLRVLTDAGSVWCQCNTGDGAAKVTGRAKRRPYTNLGAGVGRNPCVAQAQAVWCHPLLHAPRLASKLRVLAMQVAYE